jgi:hypothetical protein
MPPVIRIPFAIYLCAAVLLFVIPSFAQNTIHVPGDQATIQGAIDVANNGDTVLVAPGTYFENINFNGKAVTVTSSGGPSVTIIDGGQNGSVVTFDSGETMSSRLNGVAIQNGYASYDGSYNSGRGGGIRIMNSSPTVTGNVISNNSALCGMGIYIDGGSPVIKNNTISNNTQPSNDGGCGGGGIETTGTTTSPSSPLIDSNVITNNNLNPGGGGFGGGIYVYDFSQPTIRNNVIKSNTAYNGGGIALSSLLGTVVVQNLIANNTSLYTGAGLYVTGSNINIANNTIVGNLNSSGIFVWSNAPQTITVSNNIVVAASSQLYAITCAPGLNALSPVFSRNDAYYVGWSGVCDYTASPGNISADPLFVNSASDFHLQPNSPAIDAGTNAAANLPQTDFAGNPRILDGNNDCVGTVDMGAYELQRAANVSFSTNLLSFGNQVIGTSSSAQQATLTNSGNTCFQFSNTQITGDFFQSNNCSVAGLPGGSSCNYYATFSPTARRQRLGALTVGGSDGVSTTNLNVNLSGYGLTAQPSLSLSPVSLTFAAQLVGTTSAAQTITITSTGNTVLTISGISISGPFAQSNNCPSSLSPTATCTMWISFRPTAGGTQSGSLSISDNASGGPHTANLSGTGIDFSVSATPTSASVKHGQSAKFTVSVAPLGGAFGPAVALGCSGLPSGASCSFSPSSLTPGASGATSAMTVSVGKTPRGNYNVRIIGNSGSDSHSITVLLSVN